MSTSFAIFALASLGLAAYLPFRFGLLGLLFCHAATCPLMFFCFGVSYEGLFQGILLLLFLIAFNTALLPVSFISLIIGEDP